jgi:hypothetical protein
MSVSAAFGGVIVGTLSAIACATSQLQFELIECHVTFLAIKQGDFARGGKPPRKFAARRRARHASRLHYATPRLSLKSLTT